MQLAISTGRCGVFSSVLLMADSPAPEPTAPESTVPSESIVNLPNQPPLIILRTRRPLRRTVRFDMPALRRSKRSRADLTADVTPEAAVQQRELQPPASVIRLRRPQLPPESGTPSPTHNITRIPVISSSDPAGPVLPPHPPSPAVQPVRSRSPSRRAIEASDPIATAAPTARLRSRSRSTNTARARSRSRGVKRVRVSQQPPDLQRESDAISQPDTDGDEVVCTSSRSVAPVIAAPVVPPRACTTAPSSIQVRFSQSVRWFWNRYLTSLKAYPPFPGQQIRRQRIEIFRNPYGDIDDDLVGMEIRLAIEANNKNLIASVSAIVTRAGFDCIIRHTVAHLHAYVGTQHRPQGRHRPR